MLTKLSVGLHHNCVRDRLAEFIVRRENENRKRVLIMCQPQNDTFLPRPGRRSLHFSQPNHVELIYYVNTVLSVNTLRKYNTPVQISLIFEEMPNSNSPRQEDLIRARR